MKITYFDKVTGSYLVQGPETSNNVIEAGNQGHKRVDQGFKDQHKGGQWVMWDFATSAVILDAARIQADTDAKNNKAQKEVDIDQGKQDLTTILDAVEPDIGDPAKDPANIQALYDALRAVEKVVA